MGEVDAHVFPCLGDRYGCRRLMSEIRRKAGFLPEATWMIACPEGYVGTVQGVKDHGPIGAIQNVGVIPSYRGMGLGRALVRRALSGFCQAGLHRAYLEVTAGNDCGHPALPRGRVPAGQDFIQGGRRLKGNIDPYPRSAGRLGPGRVE